MFSNSSSFLEETAHDICHHLEGDLTNCLILLPSNLGAEIFRNLVARKVHTSTSLFEVVHVDSWVIQQSGLQIPNTLALLTVLYTCWRQIKDVDESFEQFYGWGSMLLQDFDIVDRYLVDANQLFVNLYQQKQLKPTFEQLSQEEKKAIRSFWDSFQTRLSPHQEDFLAFWEVLSKLNTLFTQELLKKKQGYTGLCYKWVCDHLTHTLLDGVKQVIIIGFNDLNPAIEKIFSWLHAHVPTSFYWDLDAFYMQDGRQEAGYYLRSHEQKSYLRASFKKPYATRIHDIPKKIKMCECHTSISQVQQIGQYLKSSGEDFSILKPQQIGIVIADETLLVPLLQELPIPYSSIYATIGYPLTHTMAYQLITQLFLLQLAIHKSTLAPHTFPVSAVIQLLEHPLIKAFDTETAMQTVSMLQRSYANSVPQDLLASRNLLYQTIFQSITGSIALLAYLVAVLELLGGHHQEPLSDNDTLENQSMILLKDKLAELQQYPAVVTALSIDRLKKLFHAFTQGVQVPFASALHTASVFIVSISDTINLDFQQIYILGMNEGCWPTTNVMGSLIPYNIRKGYGLPTQNTLQASVDAYYFYRLFHRAEEIHITYTNAIKGCHKNEMSRYLWQLLYESQLPIEQERLSSTIVNSTVYPIIIEKDGSIIAQLNQFLATPKQAASRILTPAALNTYLDCSLRFYFKYILKLPSSSPLLDTNIEAIQFGTILHKVLEQLYKTLLTNKSQVAVQHADILMLKQKVQAVLTSTLDTYIYHGSSKEVLIIEQAIIEKVIDKILDLDAAYVPFELLGIEVGNHESLVTSFKLQQGAKILLGGIIDRVDYSKGILRAIDYKTGSDSTSATSINGLFERNPIRNKAFLQVFFYAWLLKRQAKYQSHEVIPILMNIRNIFQPDFDPRLKLTKNTKGLKSDINNDELYINDIAPYAQEFEASLNEVLAALFNPQIPFVQTPHLLICGTCPYKRICQRM